MAKRRLTTVVLVLITLGLLSYLFVFSVRVDQVAAQYRLGKVLRIIRPPLELGGERLRTHEAGTTEGVPVVERAGWFFKLPWPFDKVRPLSQKVRYVDGPLTQLQLPDENQLIPRVYCTWRIVDPVAFDQSFMGDPVTAQERLKEIIDGRTPEVVGRYTLRDLVNTDPKQLKFDQIENEIFQKVKADAESPEKGYGIEVCDLGITWIALPEDATAAVFNRMDLERKTEAEKLTEQGKAIKRTTIAAANKDRDVALASADAEARRIRAEGEAEAAKSYEVFARDQEFAIFLRRLDAMKVIANKALEAQRPLTYVMDTNTPPWDILKAGTAVVDPTKLDQLPVPGGIQVPPTGGGK
jgi:membrane protease subunit HflC